MSKLKYGSLFSGVGGFDMGFDRAGYEGCWQVEWDAHCQKTLAYHWPNIPLYGDVQDVRGDELEPVDVIIYGSPCQDLSVAGKRAGIEGGRSSMFFESVRIFKEMRDATDGIFPRAVVWENVPGALTSNKGEDFRAVLTALDDIGALAQWWNVLDAQFFGVPQRRRRVFLVSVFDPSVAERVGLNKILPVGEGRRGNSSSRKSSGKDSAPAAEERAGVTGQQEIDADEYVAFHPHYHDGARPQGEVINTITSRWGTGGNNGTMVAFNTYGGSKRPDRPEGGFYVEETDTTKTLSRDGLDPTANQGGTIIAALFEPKSMREENWTERDVKNSLRAGESKSSHVVVSESTEAVNFDEFNFTGGETIHHAIRSGTRQSTGVAVSEEEPIYSFDTQFGSNANVFEDVAPTLKASQSSPTFHKGYTIRRLTPIECERLMGWPDNHTLHRIDGKTNSDSTRYKMCGNGVATPVAQWVAENLAGFLV